MSKKSLVSGAEILGEVNKTDKCWLWTGGIVAGGYGNFSIRDGAKTLNYGAHRYAFEISGGVIPEGMDLDHLCRVRHCVNPSHLEPVTPRENQIRGEGFVKDNLRKTICVNGHPLHGDNLIPTTSPSGYPIRRCLECARAYSRDFQRERRAQEVAKRPPGYRRQNGNSIKTHCKRGHPFDVANTLLYRGARYCRACNKQRQQGVSR